MKASELMVGDWVVYNGDTEYINPIKVEGMDIAVDSLITSDREDVGFEGVWPIPLTPEILKKNGFFHNKRSGAFYTYEEESYCNVAMEVTLFNVENENTNNQLHICESNYPEEVMLHLMMCNYVNELQHALRLCGINKEIEL